MVTEDDGRGKRKKKKKEGKGGRVYSTLGILLSKDCPTG